MSKIELIHGSCADQVADVIVNAANGGLWTGGGICGVIFQKAGMKELTDACSKCLYVPVLTKNTIFSMMNDVFRTTRTCKRNNSQSTRHGFHQY